MCSLHELEGRPERLGTAEQHALSIVRAYLERHRAELALDDLDQAAFVVGVTAESLTRGAVLNRPDMLLDDGITERICAMLLAYLTGAGGQP